MASQNERKKTGLGDLSQELYDKIANHVIDDNLDKGTKRDLRGLMTVNKQFYNSCTRLVYKTVELNFKNDEPYIPNPFQDLSKSERGRFVQHVDLVSKGSSRWIDTAAKMQAIREIPTVLARFPALKSLHVDLGFIVPCPPQRFVLRPDAEVEEEGELPAQPLGDDFQLYPNDIQALCLHRPFFMSGWFQGHTRDLARIMPSLRYFKFDGAFFQRYSWAGQVWDDEVLKALRYAKRLEALCIESEIEVSLKCIRYLPLDIPLRRLEICQLILPASDLVSIARFARSLEVLEIHSVGITDGSWVEVFNSLCALRRLTAFRGTTFVDAGNVPQGYEADSARQFIAFERFITQIFANKDRLGINTHYQGSSLLAARRGGRCTLGENPLC